MKLNVTLVPAVLLGLVFGLVPSVAGFAQACEFSAANRYWHFGMYRLMALDFQAPLRIWLLFTVLFVFGALASLWFSEKYFGRDAERAGVGVRLLVPLLLWVVVIGWSVWCYQVIGRRHTVAFAVIGSVSLGLMAWTLWSIAMSESRRFLPMRVLSILALMIVIVGNIAVLRLKRPADPGTPNIIFIGIDTLRADHLSCYGYYRKTSPHIDRWAENATVFENCIVSIPRTTQSLSSIMTAKYPHEIDVRHLKDKLPATELTMAEILKNSGYETISVIGTGVPYRRIDQGFDKFRRAGPREEYRADETANKAIGLLTKTKAPYFLFAFFRDPHMNYSPPRTFFDTDYQGKFKKRIAYRPDKARCVFENNYDERLREHAIALYDSEVHFTDSQIQRLIRAVKAHDDNNIIVLFADHGESLGEHNFYYDHGDVLHQPGLHVPLIFEGVSFSERRISETVRSIDIVPTVLAELKIEPTNHEFTGLNLKAPHGSLEAFSETGQVLINTAFTTDRRFVRGVRGRLRSLIYENKKLVAIPTRNEIQFEYYDLEADPEEQHNIVAEVDCDLMKSKLLGWMEEDQENWYQAERDLLEEELRSLRSLGYVD